MKKTMKQWKAIFLVVCMLVTAFSVTVFAEGELPDNDIIVSEDKEESGAKPQSVNEQSDAVQGEDTADIIELSVNNARIEFVEQDLIYTYTGNVIEPEIKVILTKFETEETDGTEAEAEIEETLDEGCYIVEYLNNVNATAEGENAVIKVTGVKEKGYSGIITAEFAIAPKALDNAKLTLSASKFVYDGKDKNPAVTLVLDGVNLKNGTDYDVTYSNNREVGTASATIEGKGNYTGTKKADYAIVLTKPTVTISPNYNKIKISWSKVTGASGYEIFRSTKSGKGYNNIKTITSGTTTSFTDTGVTFNKKYYYVVKAYRVVNGKKIYADMSSQKSQKVQTAAPKISKVSKKSATSLKITWNKVSGASGYAVYRSTSENGKYTKIATIKKGRTVSYTDKKRSCGKTYYYKIKAYRTVSKKNYYGSYSAVKSGNTTPGKVTWNKSVFSQNATSITLKWKKVPEATGYSIYRSTEKNGTYEKVKVITKNSKLSWKDKGLKKGVVYYYKIRSYKNMGKYPVYGSYSSVYTKSVGGWKYVDGYKLYYNSKGEVVKDVSNLIGKQSSYVIKVNKKKNTVTVYAKDGKKGYIIPVKSFICSTGAATPLGTFKTPQKLRWHTLDGPSYGQWCTRITGSILFHSVWYYQPKNTTLSVAQYNKLGTQASHGCVRLTAGDAKWIYDNCKLKTKVIIYNSNNPGPLGKPTAYKLKSWHTWDPTDPNMKSKCAKKGCH